MRPPLKALAAALLITVSAPAFADKVTDALLNEGISISEPQFAPNARQIIYKKS